MYVFEDLSHVEFGELTDGRLYIYAIENSPQGNVKIGRTRNIRQRLQSLSGSNGGGNRIVRVAVSEPTYLYTLEGILHQRFHEFRVPGTEWFRGDGFSFGDVVAYVDQLFASHEYAVCNGVRRDFVAKHGCDWKNPKTGSR